MCLILFSLNQHPKYRLILAANRDEFFCRETIFANSWTGNNEIFGGRDVKSMGTWLGFSANGRFIAITNYRDPSKENNSAKSRGYLSNRYYQERVIFWKPRLQLFQWQDDLLSIPWKEKIRLIIPR